MSQDTDVTAELDTERAEAFGSRMVDIFNDGCLALMTSIGHQVGLFDTMAGRPPTTSEEIARAAGLDERYVREWLGAMTTGGVVEYDPAARTYALPAEHAVSLTRAAGPENLAALTQFVPLLAAVESKIVECFRNGGGVHYSAYETFHRLMAEDSGAVHDAGLVGMVIPLVDGLPERLTEGIEAADIGCGSGHAVNLLAQAFPASQFTGFDFSDEAIGNGRAEAAAKGLTNAHFEVLDVATFDQPGRFDLITAFDAIHDQAHPRRVLANIRRALKPGGVFLMVDVRASSRLEENMEHPVGPFLYTVSTMHCMTVSLALGGEGLGTAWGRELALELLAEAGFDDVRVEEVDVDPFNFYYIARV